MVGEKLDIVGSGCRALYMEWACDEGCQFIGS